MSTPPGVKALSWAPLLYGVSVRKRPTFPSFQQAKDDADAVVNRLGNWDSDILTLTSADRAACLRARQLLDPFGLAIETAAAQIADARKLLGDVPLTHAVEYHIKRHPVKQEFKPVKVVVAELLAAKRVDGCSERYLESLKYCLGKFETRYQMNISVVAGTEVDAWLRESGLSPRGFCDTAFSATTARAFGSSRLKQSLFHRFGHGGSIGMHMEFGVDISEVGIHGVIAQIQVIGDAFHPASLGH